MRLRQGWVAATDPLWRPPPAPPGRALAWPLPLPPVAPAPRTPRLAASRWPARRHLDLFGQGRDPRDAWEETRLHDLAAAALAGDPRAAAAAAAFLRENPVGVGIAWAVPLEAAVRLVSLVLIGAATGADLRDAVAAHAAWIARHPSRGSSANNHRVAELGALALAGWALGGDAWRQQARRELPAVLEAQVHPDGVGVEQSPSYLAFDLEWALLARLCGVCGLDPALDRGARWLCALLDPGGHAPRIGDDDGGRVIALGPEPRYVRSVAGAVRSALGQAPPPGWAPDPRAALLVGPLAPRAPEVPRSASFPDGGQTVLRTARALVVVDHGPLGGCTLAAHGHADAASAWLHLDGAPLVVDRGTFRYHPPEDAGGARARRFDRSAGAHPTVLVDGVDPSVAHAHPFLWRHRAAPPRSGSTSPLAASPCGWTAPRTACCTAAPSRWPTIGWCSTTPASCRATGRRTTWPSCCRWTRPSRPRCRGAPWPCPAAGGPSPPSTPTRTPRCAWSAGASAPGSGGTRRPTGPASRRRRW
ncbi:MAG: heparinase II/III family protein [Myxococcota bacterium]